MDAILNNLSDIKTSVLAGDWNALWQMGEKSLINAVEALLLMLVCYFVAKYLSRAIANPLSKRVDQTLGRFVEKLVYRGCLGCGLLVVLAYFGVQSTSFAAIIATMGFAIGLAFQGTLSNFAAGILMLVFRPFKVGDLVVAGGITARVQEIDLFHTIVDTPDNRRLIIPNNSISSNTIENITYHPHRRIEISLSISHDANLDATRAVLQRALDATPEVQHADEKLQPQVLIVGITNISVEWAVRGWASTPDFPLIRDKLIYQVKNHLSQSEITIASPQMEVKLKDNANQKPLSGRTLHIDSDSATPSYDDPSAYGRNRLTPRRAEVS
jgi:small conductance mechanosensitive channel